jgi:hypothetical protein
MKWSVPSLKSYHVTVAIPNPAVSAEQRNAIARDYSTIHANERLLLESPQKCILRAANGRSKADILTPLLRYPKDFMSPKPRILPNISL